MVAAKKTEKKAVPGPSYQDMIKDAIIALKERSGSSRPSLKKYIKANNNITVADNMFDNFFNKALKAGVEKGDFVQPKGPSGTTKLAPKVAKPAGEKKPAVSKKVTPAKKSTAAAKPKANSKKSVTKPPKTATKATKAAPKAKPATVKKSAPAKKSVAKPAAKSAPRKKSVAAPAVVEKKTVLSKTKSGRVTKSTAKTPAVKKASARAPAKKAKKASPAKA